MTDEFPWLHRAAFGRARVLKETADEVRFQFWADGALAPYELAVTLSKADFYRRYAWCDTPEKHP